MENISAEILEHGEHKIIDLHGTKLLVFKDGFVYRWFNNKYWKFIKNNPNHNRGYNIIGVGKKLLFRHRIIGCAFLNLNINDKQRFIDHINGDKINNHVSNLRIVSNQENQWNQINARGISWNKKNKKWSAQINVNKKIHLGYFDNEFDAHQSYLNAKKKYHVIEQSIEELEAEFENKIKI